MRQVHVAIVSPQAARELLSGRKRLETRFLRHWRPPLGVIRAGDIIHFKLSGGDFIGTTTATAVYQLLNLTPTTLQQLRKKLDRFIRAPGSYWRSRRSCRYGCLIWIGPLAATPTTLSIPRQYGNAWITLPRRPRPI
jgi:hypothetical protein